MPRSIRQAHFERFHPEYLKLGQERKAEGRMAVVLVFPEVGCNTQVGCSFFYLIVCEALLLFYFYSANAFPE